LVIPPAALVLGAAAEDAVSAAPPPNTPARVHITRKGDTIARVAAKFHVDAETLAQVNRVGMRGEIMPGTRLRIPQESS
jgi:LysM repeat protein